MKSAFAKPPAEEPYSHLYEEVIGPCELCQVKEKVVDYLEFPPYGRIGEGEAKEGKGSHDSASKGRDQLPVTGEELPDNYGGLEGSVGEPVLGAGGAGGGDSLDG